MRLGNLKALKKLKGSIQNINFGKVFVVLLCTMVIMQGYFVTYSFAEPEIKTMTVNFSESSSRNRSKTVNIPNLQSIENISVDTGNVNFSVSGENVTVNTSGGSYSRRSYSSHKYSKSVSDSRTSSNNSFPSSIGYDSGGYSGTLSKSGSASSRLVSGSPGDTKTVKIGPEDAKYLIFYGRYDGDYPKDKDNYHTTKKTYSSRYTNKGATYNYNSGGYSGTLSLQSCGDDFFRFRPPSNPEKDKIYYYGYRCLASARYSGPVTKPDTRVYEYTQNYSGTAYKGGYNYYYEYTVSIEYIDNQTPSIQVSKPAENEYFGKKDGHNTILFEGDTNDADIGDSILVKYTLHNIDMATNLAGHTDVEILNVTSDGTNKTFNHSITVDDTIPSGKYELRITAEDDKGGKGEKVIPLNVDNTPPQTNPPTAIAVSDTEIEITPNATDISGLNEAETYIYNKNDEDISGWVTDTSYLDTGLTANTQYTYKYKAKDILDNESEYSPITEVYTKALNPENIVITDNGGTSLTFEITNTPQGQAPEHKLELKLKGAGANGDNVAVSDWSMETTRELTGLSIETEYELWVITRNGDNVENDKYLALGSFVTNKAPIIDILSLDNQILSEKSGYNEFIIEGTIQDSDIGDHITVYYTIEDNTGSPVAEHTIKSIASLSADSNIQEFNNYPITIDSSLPEGNYTIRIWCEDDKTGKSNEITKNFKIDKTSPTVNVATVSVISDTEIEIMPNATDTSGLNTTETYIYNRNDLDLTGYIADAPYLDTGLTANTQYTYKYKAKDKIDNESEYSPTAKIYTKALNPESILIADSEGTSLTFEINNAIQGQAPEHRLELKLKGAGASGDNVAFSDWSMETTRELTGLEKFTEYELWVTTKNGDNVENDKYLALDSFTTNIPPSLNITTTEKDINLNYNGTFELNGTVSDSDNDTVEIKASIGEIEKIISIDTLENTNWSLSWEGLELKSGLFEGITIKADDGNGGKDTKQWNGSIVINPYIKLNGANLIEIEREGRFIDPGVNSNYPVRVTGTVNTSKLGTYTLTYTATNPKGTAAKANRKIIVVKNLIDRIEDKISEINKELDTLENTKEINLPTDINDLNESIEELEEQINLLPDGSDKDNYLEELEEIKDRRDKLQEKVNNKAYFEEQINKIYIDFDNDPVILVLPKLNKGEYRFRVIDLEDNKAVISNAISTGGNIEIPGAKMGHTYRVIVEIYYKNILYSTTIFDSTYPDTIAPVITGIYRLDGEVYVLGRDNYKLAVKPYGFRFNEDSYVEKELIREDGKPLKIKAVGRMYLDADNTTYYKDNHMAINAPNTLKVLLKDKFNNICKKEITVNDKDEIIYGEVPDEIRDSIYGDKDKDNNNLDNEDIVITDPNIDEEVKDDIIDTINDTDVQSDDTELNSGEGQLTIDISDRLDDKYIGDDYRYRLDVIKKENMKLVYTKSFDKAENVEIPKLQDSTTYIVRISILKGNKELAFKEIEKMTKDRTAPIIESIVVRNNEINIIAKDNIKLHSKAYKFDVIRKNLSVMKDGITMGEGVMVASVDNSLDVKLLASSLKWTQGNWQSRNKKEFDHGTKLTVTVRDKEGNWTRSNEIVADENGIIQETINADDPLVVDKGSQVDVDEILEKIKDKLGEDINTEDLDIEITNGNANIENGKINITGSGNIVVSITDKVTNKSIQYLINAVDDSEGFKRRIIVEKKSQTNLKLAFKNSLIDEFGENKEITFETSSENVSIDDYVLEAVDNGIGTVTASDGSKYIKLYVIVADSISDVRSNIEKIDDNVAYTILKGKEVNIKDYLELEGKNVNNKYLITETDSKNINLIDGFRFKAIDEGVASIRVIDLTQEGIRNISFKVIDIKPSNKKPTDIQNHWAKETIEKAVSKGIIDGYKDNRFRPNETVSTKEFLVMLNNVKLLTNREDKKLSLIKLDKTDWSYYEVANATMGIREENLDFLNKNEWDRALTREKAVYLISKTIDIKSVSKVIFNDIEDSDYEASIKAVGSILEGYEDGTFKGNKTITRAEALTLISRILEECVK